MLPTMKYIVSGDLPVILDFHSFAAWSNGTAILSKMYPLIVYLDFQILAISFFIDARKIHHF